MFDGNNDFMNQFSQQGYVLLKNFYDLEKDINPIQETALQIIAHIATKYQIDATKRYRHLNFFQHECFLETRAPRMKLPDGLVRLMQPPWAGKLSGFTQLFEALVLCLCREIPFAAVARIMDESWRRVAAIAERYVELALAEADFPEARELAIDDTSRARGRQYVTIAADAQCRAVLFVTEIREQEPKLKGLRWKLLKAPGPLSQTSQADIEVLMKHLSAYRTACRSRQAPACRYREDLREILRRKQSNVVRRMLAQWRTNVMPSKV